MRSVSFCRFTPTPVSYSIFRVPLHSLPLFSSFPCFLLFRQSIDLYFLHNAFEYQSTSADLAKMWIARALAGKKILNAALDCVPVIFVVGSGH